MKNLDARIAMSVQGTRVRAQSGRDSTTGKSRGGVPADAFEVVFRRMKSQASLVHPGVRESTSQHDPESGQEASAIPVRAEGARLVRIQDRARAGQSTAARGGGPSSRVATFGTSMEVRAAGITLQREAAEASSVALRPASSTAATVTPLAEEATLGSIVAGAEQLVPKSDTGLPVQQPGPESVAPFPAQQPNPEVIAELPAQQPNPEMIVELPAQQLIPELLVELPAERLASESRAEPALDMRGGGAAGEKAGLVMPPVGGLVPGAEAITFSGESQRGVVHTGDMIANYPQQAVAEPQAGETPIGFVVEIQGPAFDELLSSDASVRGQPQNAAGPAAGLMIEPANGLALSQLVPAETVVDVTGVAREQLIDQVVRGVRVAQHNESTEVIVHLKPDFLGRLSIRVLSDSHAMRVEIRAGNEAVRQVMQDNLADLQQRLSEKGFAFGQFNVLADTGSNPHREPEWHFGFPPVARSNAALKTLEEVPAERAPLAAAGLIDYFA